MLVSVLSHVCAPIAAHGLEGLKDSHRHSDKSLAHIQVIGPMISPQLRHLHKSTYSGETGRLNMSPQQRNNQGRSGSEPTDPFFPAGSKKWFVLIEQPSQHRSVCTLCTNIYNTGGCCFFVSTIHLGYVPPLCLDWCDIQIICVAGVIIVFSRFRDTPHSVQNFRLQQFRTRLPLS